MQQQDLNSGFGVQVPDGAQYIPFINSVDGGDFAFPGSKRGG